MWKQFESDLPRSADASLQGLVTVEAWTDAKFVRDFHRDRRSAVEALLARRRVALKVSDEALETLTIEANPVGYFRDPAMIPTVSPYTQTYCDSSESACTTNDSYCNSNIGSCEETLFMCTDSDSGCGTSEFNCPSHGCTSPIACPDG